MWIIASATLNDDRPTKNVLRSSRGQVIPLELEKWFPQGKPWECSSRKNSIANRMKEYAKKPRLVRKVRTCSPTFVILLSGAIRILKDLNKGQELSLKLKDFLWREPGIQFLSQAQQSNSTLRRTCCCENDDSWWEYTVGAVVTYAKQTLNVQRFSNGLWQKRVRVNMRTTNPLRSS